jgi:hypothetical protein
MMKGTVKALSCMNLAANISATSRTIRDMARVFTHIQILKNTTKKKHNSSKIY